MGKAGRWFRSFFVTGRKGRKAKDRDKNQDDADAQSVSSSAAPPAREKRRWSFRRPPAAAVASRVEAGASSSSQCFSEADVRAVVVQEHALQHAVVALPEAATTAASTVVPLRPPATERGGAGDDAEAAAAIKIQSAFRSYLARKALCALRGMVKLQAMVRGQLVRRQANLTLRRMQALVDAQRRARDERLRLLEEDDDGSGKKLATATTPRPPTSRRSPQHHQRSRMSLDVVERSSEENVKVLEVDYGGEAHAARRGGSCCYTMPATPSALTDASPRTLSGRFDDDASELPCRRRTPWRADHATPPFPSYMANTESSRAKSRRSQSAPRQRLAAASESGASVAASPSPSCGERLLSGWSGGGARRRASLDPLDLLGAAAVPVERCASRARARANASLPGSECGSSAWRD